MKKLLLALVSTLAMTSVAQAMETRFSAMVADVGTGFILTADRIDSPRDPALLGRLATLSMAIQDMADGAVRGDEEIRIGRSETATMSEALEMTALGTDGYRSYLTGVVNRIGQNARVFGLRLDAVEEMADLQATAMRVVRSSDGGPDFDGYSTPRDMVRMTTSLMRAFPDSVDTIFSPATGNIGSTHIWIYEDGMCLLSADGPDSGRPLVALLTGAPDADTCLTTAAKMISRDDGRIMDARHARRD